MIIDDKFKLILNDNKINIIDKKIDEKIDEKIDIIDEKIDIIDEKYNKLIGL
jgi:hypothetical protein